MAITPSHREAEERFRQLLQSGGIAPPDDVEYEAASVVFLWHEPKVAVFVDLDDPGVEAIEAETVDSPARAGRRTSTAAG